MPEDGFTQRREARKGRRMSITAPCGHGSGWDRGHVRFRIGGFCGWDLAWERQHELVELRKSGEISDQLLIVEHPHVVTMGRNGHDENLLAAAGTVGAVGDRVS